MRVPSLFKWLWLCLLLIPSIPAQGHCQSPSAAGMTAISRFIYHAGSTDTPEIARALAVYGAKQAAVRRTAEKLAERGLLPQYGQQQKAIYCLVADAMPFATMAAGTREDGRTYTVTLSSTLSLADFVRAEIRNNRLDRAERQFDLKAELEPTVPALPQPALELSRAYRYLAHADWRKAIIYLDTLQQKYVHWETLFMVKAEAYQGLHETALAREAFAEACRLGNKAACSAAEASSPGE
jgi:hypothetical protein